MSKENNNSIRPGNFTKSYRKLKSRSLSRIGRWWRNELSLYSQLQSLLISFYSGGTISNSGSFGRERAKDREVSEEGLGEIYDVFSKMSCQHKPHIS